MAIHSDYDEIETRYERDNSRTTRHTFSGKRILVALIAGLLSVAFVGGLI